MVESQLPVQPGTMKAYGALPILRLTADRVRLIRTGIVYSLAVVHYEGIPYPEPMVPYTLSPRLRHGDLTDIAPASAAAEVITMAGHTGTHLDALCHIGGRQDAESNPDLGGTVRLFASAGQTAPPPNPLPYRTQTHLSLPGTPPIPL